MERSKISEVSPQDQRIREHVLKSRKMIYHLQGNSFTAKLSKMGEKSSTFLLVLLKVLPGGTSILVVTG